MPRISTRKVSTGIHWVEVPEAGLYVLCGCPADSVKFLMKAGLNAPATVEGVPCETGPNAILLSDVLVQNGSFSNLSEFPLLQMLYRQGMILPNHPNNTGAKPLLIGSKSQVEAQMQYILRGNYGLISQEEIEKTGIPPDEARDLMRMKLKFAFGSIRTTDELLDTVIVDDGPVEITGGVSVRRLKMNVFEFTCGDERITVDLNLSPGEQYELPFPLDCSTVKREHFSVVHSGEGDGWDTSRQCVSSVLVFQGKIYLVDAGPSFLHSLRSLGISVNEIEGIFHTHSHDDHFAGIPALIQTDRRIKYFATPLVRAAVTRKIGALLSIDEKNFFDYFDVHDLEFDTWNDIGGLEVMPLLSPHPVETSIFVFRARWNDGYHTYAHYEDIIALEALESMITDDPSSPGISRDFFQRVKRVYLTGADLKKIDIGGGIIHGVAEDFRTDPSGRILLTHIPRPLTGEEKEIGSNAPFGEAEVLIPTFRDYIRQSAADYLRSYFPTVDDADLNNLLNNPVVTFEPGAVILEQGSTHTDMYLILSGNVEILNVRDVSVRNVDVGGGLPVHRFLPAGSFVGDMSGLTDSAPTAAYRADGCVQALRFSTSLYRELVRENRLYDDIEQLRENQDFLLGTWLFGDAISSPVQNTIARSMQWLNYHEGDEFSPPAEPAVYVIRQGSVQRYYQEHKLEELAAGDFFGEESVLFELPGLFSFRTVQNVDLCRIPGQVLLDIPVIRWKLYETFEKRKGSILDPALIDLPEFFWRPNLSLNVQTIDLQHRQIFDRTDGLYETLEFGAPRDDVLASLEFMIEYVRFHFTEEEALMEKHRYPGYGVHKKKHQDLLGTVMDLQERLQGSETIPRESALAFLKDWMAEHILIQDRVFGRFLNRRGLT